MGSLVNTSSTVCVRCLNSISIAPVDTVFVQNGNNINNVSNVDVIEGVLVIQDPTILIPDGNAPLTISCSAVAQFVYRLVDLFSNSKLSVSYQLSKPIVFP